MTRINTKTHCDLSGCDHTIVGPTRGSGWTIWMGKDLCPEHDVTEMQIVYPEEWPDSVMLYDSPNHMRNVDGNQMEFRTVTWCIAHDSSGRGPSPKGEVCHYSALRQATELVRPHILDCEFVDKLIEV